MICNNLYFNNFTVHVAMCAGIIPNSKPLCMLWKKVVYAILINFLQPKLKYFSNGLTFIWSSLWIHLICRWPYGEVTWYNISPHQPHVLQINSELHIIYISLFILYKIYLNTSVNLIFLKWICNNDGVCWWQQFSQVLGIKSVGYSR